MLLIFLRSTVRDGTACLADPLYFFYLLAMIFQPTTGDEVLSKFRPQCLGLTSVLFIFFITFGNKLACALIAYVSLLSV